VRGATILELSGLLGRKVVAGDRSLGRLVDLGARIGEPYPRITRLVVGRERRHFPWSAVSGLEAEVVRLEAAVDEIGPELEGELLLREDVLDCQIFDFAERRLTRVGDVALAQESGGLRACAVEIGAAPILRRLGLHGLARRATPQALDWEAVHLASVRGHALQLDKPTAAVHRLSADEIARLVSRLPGVRGAEVLEAIEPEKAAKAKNTLAERHPPRRRFRKILSVRRRAPA
jgi:hypothetical protein